MFGDKPKQPKYGSKVNIVKISNNQFGVLKYLLAPKYYPVANEEVRQLKVRGLHYVLFSGEEIIDDLGEFTRNHVLDDYSYPMDNCTYPTYVDKSPYPQQINISRWLLGWEGKGDPVNNGKGHHLHSSMRTGKSVSCLWATDFGLKSKIFKKVLIASPKTVMRSTWAKELSNHFPDIKYTLKVGVARDRPTTTPIDIINHDGLTIIIEKGLIADYDLIIYDECTAVKTSNTTRWKQLNKYLVANEYCRIWLLTGTPLAQSPLAAYGPAKLVAPQLVPRSFTAWRQQTMYNPWGFEWLPRAEAPTLCAKALQPSRRFQLKDISDIPDHVFEYIECDKSVKQFKMFKRMAEEFVTEYDSHMGSGTIQAVNAASKTSKLLQILSGVIYDEAHKPIVTDATPRLDALTDLIDMLPEDQPVVIFAEWTHTQEMLKAHLTPKYKTVEIINGATPNNDSETGRLAIERRVQNKQTKIVIPHPVTCALGLDFSSTNVVIWYTTTFRGELYQQGNDRIRNFASKSRGLDKFIIYHLISDPIERMYFNNLKDKLLTQDEFFSLVRQSLKDEFAI